MKRSFVLILLLLVALAVSAEGQEPNSKVAQQSSFRYVIVANATELQKSVNEDRYNTNLEVLMEDHAFTEANLVELFHLLGSRFKDKPWLTVYVYTSLDALRTPEEYDRTRLWGPVDNFDRFKYALYSRTPKGEMFKYGIPGQIVGKEVTIRGPR